MVYGGGDKYKNHFDMSKLVVHHLDNSRSQRILWLLEELEVSYEINFYVRDKITNLAPPELLEIHPLGKSPVITDNGRTIYESGAIVEYLCDKYSSQLNMVPSRGTDDYIRHLEFMHFAEGSAMTPILLNLYTSRLGESAAPLMPRIIQQLNSHFSFMESQLNDSGYFIGNSLSAADIMLSFPAEIAVMQNQSQYPKLHQFVGKRPVISMCYSRLTKYFDI